MLLLTLPSKMPRPSVYYDVRVYPIRNSVEKYVILYNGVGWCLAHRGPDFYKPLGTYPTPDDAEQARVKHHVNRLSDEIRRLKEALNNEE